MSAPLYSVILPIYNQSAQLEFLFREYVSLLDQLGDPWELIFVVNGSRDDSHEKAIRLANNHPSIKVFNLEKGGWGRAVKFGLTQATGRLVCYTNSARTHLADLSTILKFARTDESVVIKTTRVVRETFVRKIGSILYNYENRKLMGTPVWDVNGTPKVIPLVYVKDLQLISDGDLIDAEVMAKLYRKKAQIIEVLILSTKRIDGRSTTTFKSALKMYWGLLKLRNEK
jgi:glycosyltransferase involved in cell wall biosynthesis